MKVTAYWESYALSTDCSRLYFLSRCLYHRHRPILLIRCSPSAEIEDRTGGEGILFRNQPGNHGGNLFDCKKSSSWDTRQHVIDMLLRNLVEDPSAGRCRRNTIHRDI